MLTVSLTQPSVFPGGGGPQSVLAAALSQATPNHLPQQGSAAVPLYDQQITLGKLAYFVQQNILGKLTYLP